MSLLKLKNLSKTYPNGVKALDNISIEISSGMFGLLGPNGAGKSSMMRTIATLQDPDKGSIFFDELNILENSQEFRKNLGYLPQEFGVYPRISAEQLLDHIATLKGITNKLERKDLVSYLLQKVNLFDRKNKKNRYEMGKSQASRYNPRYSPNWPCNGKIYIIYLYFWWFCECSISFNCF